MILLFLFTTVVSFQEKDSRCASFLTKPIILIMYDSGNHQPRSRLKSTTNISNFHTYQLAQAIATGINSSGAVAQLYNVSNTNAPTTYEDVTKVHALAIGSPVFFANPSSATLSWMYRSLGPGWENRMFADLPCSVFATGGGYHQGTEGTLQGLTRGMLNFGFRPVTPNVVTNGYASSLGASAVTGTPPYFLDTDPISEHFLDIGISLGKKLALETQKEWKYRCL